MIFGSQEIVAKHTPWYLIYIASRYFQKAELIHTHTHLIWMTSNKIQYYRVLPYLCLFNLWFSLFPQTLFSQTQYFYSLLYPTILFSSYSNYVTTWPIHLFMGIVKGTIVNLMCSRHSPRSHYIEEKIVSCANSNQSSQPVEWLPPLRLERPKIASGKSQLPI